MQVRQEEEAAIASVNGEIQHVVVEAIGTLPGTSCMISQETPKEPYCKGQGWPRLKTSQLEEFYNRHQSLTIIDGCLLFDDRVVMFNSSVFCASFTLVIQE
ncbi:hypothetical protein D918_06604 [Trichuris suis]|nr:hypothetical protein D918_06604 [Trichuris suis]